MDFRVLGPLEAYRDGERISLGSFRQRSLLAYLLMHPNEIVSTDRLIDELWGDAAGPDRQNALWVHVSNLRSALEPDRARRSEGALVLTRSPGYLVQVQPDEVDVGRFEHLLQEGRLLLDRDPAAASLAVGEGLALWRGRPYEDFAYESFAQAEIARLEELRNEAVELRVDADLRRGLAAELVGELEALACQHPLRERLTAFLMVALYRSGRRADALKAYRRLRMRLVEDLGLEPSDALVTLEGRILAQDPALDQGGSSVGHHARVAVRGYELREKLGDGSFGSAYRAYQPLVGREVAIKVTRAELANDPAFIQRFEAEAELVARLEHPHIVPLYDYWREPDAAYLVLRLFRTGNLADSVRRGRLEPQAAAQLATDLGSALALAHRHGVVHGDIKPANVLLDDDHRAYLTDFAIAVEHEDDREQGAPPVDDRFAAPERRAGQPATVRSDVYGLAAVVAYSLTGRPPNGLGGNGIVPTEVADVLRRATSEDPAARYGDATSFTRALEVALGSAPASVPPEAPDNPYKGLRPFEEADAPDYFGRERLVERLVARLGASGSQGRFVAIVGPSGSGKSSVVHAGLVPVLRRGAVPGAEQWFVVSVTPGHQPFEALGAALRAIAVDPPASLAEELTAGEAGIRRAVQRVLPDPRSQLLLIVDQFEELFTQAPEDTAQEFLDALAAAVEDPHGHLRAVITLRADFYDRPLRHRAIGELLRRGTEVITPMSPQELERAIDGPSQRAGVQVDPGVVAEVVSEVADRAGALPLLQYALTELFESRRGQVLEVAAYRELGGVSGALARRAEDLYDQLDPAAHQLTRQLFLRLVALGEGGEIARRRVPRHELAALGGRQVDHVLDAFGRHRLLTFDRDPVTRAPTVEIAHEALITAWDRLRRWIEDGRDDVRHQRRLAAAASEWLAADRDDGYLLHGPSLDQLVAWTAATDMTLHPAERSFLDASVARRDAEQSTDEARRRREQRLRRQTRERARLLVGSVLVLAALAALAAVAVVKSNDAGRLADEIAAVSEARRLSAASTGASRDDPQLATLLALQALEVSTRAGIPALPEAEDAVHWAIQGAAVTYPVADAPAEVRFGPNGRTGVFALPLDDLVDIARGSVTRRFTAAECDTYNVERCPLDGGGLATPASDGPRALPASATRPEAPAGLPLAGTTVSLWGVQAPAAGLQDEFDRFEDRTGIHVEYRVFDTHLNAYEEATAEPGGLPDLAMLPLQGQVRDLADRGALVNLTTFLDAGAARRQFSDYLIDSVAADEGFYAVPVRLEQKGLVWYPIPEFEEAGYTVPRTWDELIALSRQMVADGRRPWCLGLESGDASGWPATDWIEALVLRLGGPEMYDQWVNHEIPFDHPVVHQAMAMFGEIAFGPDFVAGGVETINRSPFISSGYPMFDEPPGCWMFHMASYLMYDLPPGVTAGVDTGFFVLPPITAGGPASTFGAGDYAVAFHDRPEVREFLRTLMSPEWGAAWAAQPGSMFMPANADFDPEQCRSPDDEPSIGDLRVQLCEASRASVAAGEFRYDGSDLMPPEVGAGSFWQGMVDYIDQGPDSIDTVLARIEASWPA